MKLIFKALFIFLFIGSYSKAQNWSLKLSSKIELRTWRLSSTATKIEKPLQGATITLFKDKTQIAQTTSDPQGDFEINIPAKGDYILVIAYTACNTKKFQVTTNNVPTDVGKDNYKPTVNITGFLMSKPLKGVDYIGLDDPLIKVEYKAKGQNFDKDETITNKGISTVSKIYDAENVVIDKFCAANKAGDEAMKKKNCIVAKEFYQKAILLLPGEQYPVDQKEKAEQCIKDKKQKEEVLAQEKIENAEAKKAENDKLIADKKAKENETFNKNTTSNSSTTTPINTSTNDNSDTETNSPNKKSKGSKYSMPQKLGANLYKEAITKADGYFKTKRYKEAKAAYQEALNEKPNDVYATTKLADCEKQLQTN